MSAEQLDALFARKDRGQKKKYVAHTAQPQVAAVQVSEPGTHE
jgi:hypothetical protein